MTTVLCDHCGMPTEEPSMSKTGQLFLCETCSDYCEPCHGTGKEDDGVTPCRGCKGSGLQTTDGTGENDQDYWGW